MPDTVTRRLVEAAGLARIRYRPRGRRAGRGRRKQTPADCQPPPRLEQERCISVIIGNRRPTARLRADVTRPPIVRHIYLDPNSHSSSQRCRHSPPLLMTGPMTSCTGSLDHQDQPRSVIAAPLTCDDDQATSPRSSRIRTSSSATTNSDSIGSPAVSLLSLLSQPQSDSFSISQVSNLCINNLFDDPTSHDHTQDIDSNVPCVSLTGGADPSAYSILDTSTTRIPPPPRRTYCAYFPRFWLSNIRGGLTTKIDEIAEVISANNIDIAVLVETWLHVNIHDDLLCIAGYTVFRKDRTDGRSGGGILVYVKDSLPCQSLPQLDVIDTEVLWLLYRRPLMPREISHILIGAVYHPPNGCVGPMLNHLISSMDAISRLHPSLGIILLGDFNHLPDNQLRLYPLKQLVSSPTRQSAILDKIYTNISSWFQTATILPAVSGSDHDSVLLAPSLTPVRPRRLMKQVHNRTSDSSCKTFLCHYVQHFNWTSLYRLDSCADMVDYFYVVVLSALDHYLPTVKINTCSTDKPWVTPTFRNLIKKRQKAFLENNLSLYKRLRNSSQRMAAKLRKKYYTSKVEQLHSSDPRQWWKKTKRFLNIQQSNPLSSLDFQGPPSQLAHDINDFFVSVSSHLPKVDRSILSSLSPDYTSDFTISPAEVERRLVNINIHKAPGPDGLPNWFLRDFAPYISQPLAAIFNASIREGYVPPIWKAAEVIPVPKKPRPRHINTDLRPISLLPCVTKVLEAIVGQWLSSALEASFDPNQFGCRRNRSTTHALTAITHEWQTALDHRKAVRIVLVDYRKAFDSVNHNIILSKLYQKQVPHCLIRWFFSYLDKRTQRVRADSHLSGWLQLKGGMPQGSGLGPLCFLVLIDDLQPNCPVHKYVDDTTLTEIISSPQSVEPSKMPQYLQQLLSWSSDNDMVVNCDKTKEMVIGPPRLTRDIPPLTLPGGHIERVHTVKLLGIHFNNNFSWSSHVEALVSKATQRIYFLKQLKRAGLSTSQLIHFYISVIRPVLEYSSPVWHHLLNNSETDHLESIQKRAIRIIYPYCYPMPYTSMLLVADLQSLATRRQISSQRFFNSITQPISPLHYILPPERDSAIISTLRSASKYPRIPTRTKKYQSFISYALTKYQ